MKVCHEVQIEDHCYDLRATKTTWIRETMILIQEINKRFLIYIYINTLDQGTYLYLIEFQQKSYVAIFIQAGLLR